MYGRFCIAPRDRTRAWDSLPATRKSGRLAINERIFWSTAELTAPQPLSVLFIRSKVILVSALPPGRMRSCTPVDPGHPQPGRPPALVHLKLKAKSNEFELQRGPVQKARKERRRAAGRELYASNDAIREYSNR